jgi:hypothetical protein
LVQLTAGLIKSIKGFDADMQPSEDGYQVTAVLKKTAPHRFVKPGRKTKAPKFKGTAAQQRQAKLDELVASLETRAGNLPSIFSLYIVTILSEISRNTKNTRVVLAASDLIKSLKPVE